MSASKSCARLWFTNTPIKMTQAILFFIRLIYKVCIYINFVSQFLPENFRSLDVVISQGNNKLCTAFNLHFTSGNNYIQGSLFGYTMYGKGSCHGNIEWPFCFPVNFFNIIYLPFEFAFWKLLRLHIILIEMFFHQCAFEMKLLVWNADVYLSRSNIHEAQRFCIAGINVFEC